MVKTEHSFWKYELTAVDTGIFRVRVGWFDPAGETLLERYRLIDCDGDIGGDAKEENGTLTLTAGKYAASLDIEKDTVTFTGGKRPLSVHMKGIDDRDYRAKGFELHIPLSKTERLYGMGDVRRDGIQRRGKTFDINIVNVDAYGPVPYFMSTDGWSVLVNCTFPQVYDLGNTDPDKAVLTAENGFIDYFIFLPEDGSMTGNLELSTRVTGRPVMMPKSFYGFTFVFNEMTDARHMLYECKMFRDDDIPLDTVGLEPKWMDKVYDFSTEKKWSPDRFWIPDWMPDNNSGNWTFLWSLKNLGYKLSLWLCNDYDLLWEEERQVGNENKPKEYTFSYVDAMIRDKHFSNSAFLDALTKRDEPWFKHLEKFVDNGAGGFKLDGCAQVNHHPDRYWACKYHDDEVHNVYPVIYVKQMKEGFEKHTNGRRVVLYTPCVYAGSQKYAASWAGDTGGGFKTLTSMLNYGFCGHTNVSCDMDPSPEGIHYGFFLPWVQYLGWNNWQQPWFLGDELHNMIRTYSKQRSSLFPYIYSMAHKANETGVPIARAISLMHPDHPEYDDIRNCYYFGDNFLVGAFDMHLTLPEGKWTDYVTGRVYNGGQEVDYEIPQGRGGALLVRDGAIFCTQAPQPYIEQKVPTEYDLHVYPGRAGNFTLVDDDGLSYQYENGAMAKTQFTLSEVRDGAFTVTIGERIGNFEGRKRREDEPESTPDFPGMPAIPGFTVILHGVTMPKHVFCGEEELPWRVIDNNAVVTVSQDAHRAGNVTIRVEI